MTKNNSSIISYFDAGHGQWVELESYANDLEARCRRLELQEFNPSIILKVEVNYI